MTGLNLRVLMWLSLVWALVFSSVSAVIIERADSIKQEQETIEDVDSPRRIDIYIGLFTPYSNISYVFERAGEQSVDGYKVILPGVDAGWSLGGTVGMRQILPNDFTGTIEVSYYRGSHNYSWAGFADRVFFGALSGELCFIYSRFPVQPFILGGGSIIDMDVQNGAEDAQMNKSAADFWGLATKIGVGININVSRSVWLSGRIAYRKLWFPGVTIEGDNFSLDKTIKAEGILLTLGLCVGIRIK